ncbi:hypothetical protein JTB14_036245 [Gonioctena quinquepunctata]|nr:hypothetical protein JTB14_036245 [Gonioctena quinquepunctata]
MMNHYGAPSGFYFDIMCPDEPVNDNPDSFDYNAPQKKKEFEAVLEDFASHSTTENILIPMGGDFTYELASEQSINMDKLINIKTKTSIPLPSKGQPQDHGQEAKKRKADLFTEHLAEVFRPSDMNNQKIIDFLDINLMIEEAIKVFTPNEINKGLFNFSHRKSPIPDQVSEEMLKELHKKSNGYVTPLFNAVLRLQ